jgi:lysozyme family protein
MTAANFSTALAFVWQPGFDDPDDGYHVTVGDPGGGTFGGVIEAIWDASEEEKLVSGPLSSAAREQLSLVLETEYWGDACNGLPSGVDLMLFNGRMMTGHYPRLFQQCVGFTGVEVDGDIGRETIAVSKSADPTTLINALTGVHYAYLTSLRTWPEFRDGWTKRLLAARDAAIALAAQSTKEPTP